MNFELPFVPERPIKPRANGLTMVIDKGLCINGAAGLVLSGSDYIDFVKIGFGTALIAPNLDTKLAIYREAGMIPYFGGTLFELFAIRNCFDDFCRFIDKYKLEYAEISDGSIFMPHGQKLEFIRRLSKKVTVISEVGSKMDDVVYTDDEWTQMMKAELEAGAWKVIAEARESGTAGVFNSDGSANASLITAIGKEINMDDVIWEAPQKNQQVMFIKLIGSNVNLGNIHTGEVIALESLRLGLRGDTFFHFLPDELSQKVDFS
jgi:phosphosulfolactate synthase